MAEASDFKFGTQLGFAKVHHEITPRRKVGVDLGLFPMVQKLSKAIMNYHSYSRKYSGPFFIACVVMK